MFTNSRAAILTAIVPALGFSLALSHAMVPSLPAWASTQAEAAQATIPPFYLQLDPPLRVGLSGGRTQVMASLAFSARLDEADLMKLAEVVSSREDRLRAAMTAVLLDAAEAERNLSILREALPGRLRDAINAGLASDDLPAPVDQVLVLDLMFVPN